MSRTACEVALTRALSYLSGAGVPIDRKTMLITLRVIETALAESPDDLEDNSSAVFARVMDLLPQHFELPELPLPPSRPPLTRGSIGYDPF